MREASCPCRPESPQVSHDAQRMRDPTQPWLYTANKLYNRYTKLYWECQPCGKKYEHTHADNGAGKLWLKGTHPEPSKDSRKHGEINTG